LGPNPTRVLDRLAGVIDGAGLSHVAGVPVAAPRTDSEVSGLMRVASEERWKVFPQGAGLAPAGPADPAEHEGPAPSGSPDLVVSSIRMGEVVDYEPADLNVTVRAGMTLGGIQSSLRAEEQWLALDPPGGHAVTLGGVVSTGLSGPLRPQYGRPRDHVLGLTVVDGQGRVLSLGGRVVKNVAGFDLVRLATGSRGALGMITELTFRVHPKLEEDWTLEWMRADLGAAWDLGRALGALQVPLAAAELLSGEWPEPLKGDGARVVVRITASRPAVQRTVDLLSEIGGPPDRSYVGEESEAVSLAIAVGLGGRRVTFRLHALPSRGRILIPTLHDTPFERLALHLLGGTFRGTIGDGADLGSLPDLAEHVRGLGAGFEVTGTEHHARFGAQPPSAKGRLVGELVRAFDPSGVLPGTWRTGWNVPGSPPE